VLTSDSVIEDKIKTMIIYPFDLERLAEIGKGGVDVPRLDLGIKASQFEDTCNTSSHRKRA